MSNTIGTNFAISIFGSSHSKTLGLIIKGMPDGYVVDETFLMQEIERRKPKDKWTTPRREKDIPTIQYNDNEICISFENKNIRDNDYNFIAHPRPSHADYVQLNKYGADSLYGGGMSSGRMTILLVAAGAVAKDIIRKNYMTNVKFSSRIVSIGGKQSNEFEDVLEYCRINGDSVGACIECIIENVSGFVGEPFFDSIESKISHLAFSVPGIKAIEFGDGVECSKKPGSERNDIWDGYGHTKTNNEGGINGGISNGMPIVFRVHAKPTPSIGKKQCTYDFERKEMRDLEIGGRHDICFALRVPVVIESIAAIALLDLILEK